MIVGVATSSRDTFGRWRSSPRGPFGRAADRLGYTQSSVSQHIASLERAVGGRSSTGRAARSPVQLTPLGERGAGARRDLLSDADALDAAVERFRAGEGRLDIGTFQSVSNTLPPVGPQASRRVPRLRDPALRG